MQLGFDYEIILDVYKKEICSVIECGAIVYHSRLTKRLSNMKDALNLIPGLDA